MFGFHFMLRFKPASDCIGFVGEFEQVFGGTGHYSMFSTVDVLYAVLSLEQILLVNLG